MREFRLDDSLLTTSLRYRQLTIHKVRNCLIRNIITPDSAVTMGYEHHLKQEQFIDEEFGTMLSLICCKDQYSLDDRNAIRRILLNRFDEWLLEGVKHEQFYNHVKYDYGQLRFTSLKAGDEAMLETNNQQFWMLLTGKVRARNSQGVETIYTGGKHFGHQQILGGIAIRSLTALTDSHFVYVPADVFVDNLGQLFSNKIQRIEKELCRAHAWTSRMNEYERVRFLLSLQKMTLKESSVICKKDNTVKYVYFVLKGNFAEEGQDIVSDSVESQFRVVGLRQYLETEEDAVRYASTIICETECELYRTSLRVLKTCTSRTYLKQLMGMRTLNESERKEIRNKQRRYQFRIKQAKIVLSRSSRKYGTMDSAMITNNFRFLRDRSDLLKDKLRIRKTKTEGRNLSLTCEDPEKSMEGLLPYVI